MSVLASVSAGTLTDTTIILFGWIPPDEMGIRIRAVNVVVSVELSPNASDYWVLEVGTWKPGTFEPKARVPLQNGLKRDGLRQAFTDAPSVRRGQIVALRALQRGSPPPLEALSAALEYNSLGSS